jgi:hypothetical protein
VVLLVLEIVTGVVVFGVSLFALTYSTAFVADVTGYFRLLFIQRPYQQVFRLVRWLLAAAAALGVLAIIE